MINILAVSASADTLAVITVVASVILIVNIRYSISSSTVSVSRVTVVVFAGSFAVNVRVVSTAA